MSWNEWHVFEIADFFSNQWWSWSLFSSYQLCQILAMIVEGIHLYYESLLFSKLKTQMEWLANHSEKKGSGFGFLHLASQLLKTRDTWGHLPSSSSCCSTGTPPCCRRCQAARTGTWRSTSCRRTSMASCATSPSTGTRTCYCILQWPPTGCNTSGHRTTPTQTQWMSSERSSTWRL